MCINIVIRIINADSTTGTQCKASDVSKRWATVGVNCRLVSEPKQPGAALISQSTTSSPATQTNILSSQGSEYLPTNSEENDYEEERYFVIVESRIVWD